MPVFIHAQVIFFHVESKTQDSLNLEAETKPESALTQAVTCKGKSVGEPAAKTKLKRGRCPLMKTNMGHENHS